jgi:hypothetical protein
MKMRWKSNKSTKDNTRNGLFCDGKVKPRLKPPPCNQYATDGKFDNHGSTPTSPESQMAKIKISLPRRNVWNDDIDPFMVALKTVKGEGKEKWQKINHTRARSVSPIRARSELMDCMHNQCKQLDPIRPNLNNHASGAQRVAYSIAYGSQM